MVHARIRAGRPKNRETRQHRAKTVHSTPMLSTPRPEQPVNNQFQPLASPVQPDYIAHILYIIG